MRVKLARDRRGLGKICIGFFFLVGADTQSGVSDSWIMSCTSFQTPHVASVGIDLHQLAQRPTGPLNCALIGGAQPIDGWWAPVAQRYKDEVGASGTSDEVHRRLQ
jgi:hypothetical protein